MISWLLYPRIFMVLCILALLATSALMRRYLWQKRTVRLLGGPRELKYFSLWRKFLKAVLTSLSLFFLALALARPQWGEVSQQVTQEGRDVLIALDVSRSMLAQDIKPSRIEVAKRKIKELLTQLPAERVSLLLFSGIALVQCPFTQDTQAFLNFLDIADVEATSSGTTALDTALSESIKAFKTVPGRSSRIVVVCTDGEDFSTNLTSIEAEAQKEGIHIFTMGIGTLEGAPIPLYDDEGHMQGHQKDAQGNVVITRLNEQLLDELSKKTGGSYIPYRSDNKDIATLVQLVHRFEKQKFDDTTIAVKEEHYALFALLSALLLLGEWIL